MPKTLNIPEGYVPLINPSGEIAYYPKEDAPENVGKYGYKVPTSDDLNNLSLEKQYGEGIGNQLTTSAEGLASGATFGLSRHATNALGITTPEEQAAHKKFFPTTALASELGGFVGSAFIPGSAVGLLGRGAATVGEGVAAGAKALGVGETLAQKILGGTITGAVEGAGFGAAQPINESALGDTNITAQKVFKSIGLGSLIGGGTGLGLGLLGVGAKRIFGKYGAAEGEVATPAQAPASTPGSEFNAQIPPVTKEHERIAKELANDATPQDVAYFEKNYARMKESPRLATKTDPTQAGVDTLEDHIRDAYERVTPRIEQLGKENQSLLEQSGISKSSEELAGIVDQNIKRLEDIKVKGSETKTAIAKLQALRKDITEAGGEFTSQDIKQTIGEIDKDLKPFYAGKIGKVTTEQERVLLQLRSDISDSLKKEMADAGFPQYESNLDEMHNLLGVRQNVEKHFSADTWYQRAIRAFEKNELNVASGAPLAKRGSKEGVSYFQDMIDLGNTAGEDFGQLYKDRAVLSRIQPAGAEGMEKGSAFLQLLRGVANLARHPTEIPGKAAGTIFDMATGKTTGLFVNIRRKMAQDALMGGSSSSSVANNIVSKLKGAASSGSALFDGLSGSQARTAAIGAATRLIEGANDLDHQDRKVDVLLALEKAQKKADQEISSTVTRLFENRDLDAKLNSPSVLKKTPSEQADDLEKMAQRTQAMLSNQELYADNVSKSLAGLGTHAPGVAAGLTMAGQRALGLFSEKLAAYMPKEAPLPLDHKNVPSQDQWASLSKTAQYINDPMESLKELASGRVSKEAKEVWSRVYPELYEEVKAKLLDGVLSAKAKGMTLPMAKRNAIAYFLEMPLDQSQTPAAISQNQMAFAMPNKAPSQQMPKPSAKSPNATGRMLTPLQKVAQR